MSIIEQLIKDYKPKTKIKPIKSKDFYTKEERNNYNKWYYENVTKSRRQKQCKQSTH